MTAFPTVSGMKGMSVLGRYGVLLSRGYCKSGGEEAQSDGLESQNTVKHIAWKREGESGGLFLRDR